MSENRAEARISLDNIEQNYRYLRQKAGENCIVMAVVKADAYGHGAVEVCRRLSAAGAGGTGGAGVPRGAGGDRRVVRTSGKFRVPFRRFRLKKPGSEGML